MTYKFSFSIEAQTEKDANEKMKALALLASNLKINELLKLAEIIEKDPVKTRLAKTYLGL
jgi:hypothetical protein